jgi:hypothetical protein
VGYVPSLPSLGNRDVITPIGPLSGGAASAYATEVLADSPYLYWRLNDTSGTTAQDTTANNRDGTYAGTFTLAQPGPVDLAVDVDGSTGRVGSGVAPFLNANAWTYEGFAWRDTDGTIDVLFGGEAAGCPRLHLAASNVIWDPNINAAGGDVTWGAAWPGTAQWVHWALVFNPGADTVALYINGALVSSQACAEDFFGSPGVFVLGAAGGTLANHFDGKFAEVAVYASALSGARIAAHYAAA